MRTADTITTPAFLGLSAPGGLWDQLGGPGRAGAGRGIVIGDIDSGIWPESTSFAPLVKPGKLSGWNGTCQTGQQFDASDCTNKIIGARYFDAGWGGDAQIPITFPTEYVSARDSNGHGTHTASTAGGDNDVPFVINGNLLGNGTGMAPNARIAVYKALWNTGASATGTTSDLVAAIDDAVADGVDVINYSISGSLNSDVDPVEVAFFNAATAGVFVAASAGNSGPARLDRGAQQPVADDGRRRHPRPRLPGRASRSATARPTHGVGIGAAVPSCPIVLSSQAGLAGAATAGARCASRAPGSGAPGASSTRPRSPARSWSATAARTTASTRARRSSRPAASAWCCPTPPPNSLNVDFHSVPTVHVDNVDGAAIKAYVAGTANPTASLGAGHPVRRERPAVAAFSSRGPALAGSGDLLKPDIMAPGVDVAGRGRPPNHGGRNFDFESGTSMSSPHIAGIAALLIAATPGLVARWRSSRP